jgi:hypothetical protein
VSPNSAPKRAIVLLGETFKRIDFRTDLLIILSLSVNLSRCQLSAARAKRIQRTDFRTGRLNFFSLNLKSFYPASIPTSRHSSLQAGKTPHSSLQAGKTPHSSLQADIHYKSRNDFRIIIR